MKETRSVDGDEETAKWQHKVLLGIDETGIPRAYFFKDVFGWDDAKRYIKIVRCILNEQYKRVTNGWNCPLRDDEPVEPELAPEGVGLLHYIVIGTESITTPGEVPRDVVRLFVPDETANMKGFADHVEKLVHVIDAIKASRGFR